MALKVFVIFLISIMLACGGGDDEVDLGKQLGIPENFSPSYSIHSVKDVDIPTARRKAVKITVPKGLKRSVLVKNLKHAVKTIYRNSHPHPNAISVLAYKSGTDHNGYYTAGKCDFAPEGDWGKAEYGIPVERFSTKIEISEMYSKKEEFLKNGSKVKLVETHGKRNVRISNRPDEWRDENIIIIVPVGKTATIIGHKGYSNINVVRYKVEFNYKGRKIKGWVHKRNVKPSR